MLCFINHLINILKEFFITMIYKLNKFKIYGTIVHVIIRHGNRMILNTDITIISPITEHYYDDNMMTIIEDSQITTTDL